MIEPLLLATPRVLTYRDGTHLTNASGFFFRRDDKLFLVTSRHVVIDEDSEHFPDSLVLEIHTDLSNLAASTEIRVPLLNNGAPLWRDGKDLGGTIDVAVVPLAPDTIPDTAAYYAYTPEHIPFANEHVRIGSTALVVGFPLGFHDTLHHLPVVRQAIIASSFGFRFQGNGYFLTDARTHRGISGAPVVAPVDADAVAPSIAMGNLPWRLLGVHSARLDIGTRDVEIDEALGLNCAWYADVLMVLTED